MNKLLTSGTLRKQNLAFVSSGGVSENSRSSGFRPAFYDRAPGRAEPARFADGRLTLLQLPDDLPDERVAQRGAGGRITASKESVAAGGIRAGLFYSREQAAAAALH